MNTVDNAMKETVAAAATTTSKPTTKIKQLIKLKDNKL